MRKAITLILPMLAVGCAVTPGWDSVPVGRPLPPLKRDSLTLGSMRGIVQYEEPNFARDHVTVGCFRAVVDDAGRVVVKSRDCIRFDANAADLGLDANRRGDRNWREAARESNCVYTKWIEFEVPPEAFHEPPAEWVIPDRWIGGALCRMFDEAPATASIYEGNEPVHVLGRVPAPQGGHVWKLNFEQFKDAIRDSARDQTFIELFFWGKDGGKDSNFCYQLERLEHHLGDNVAGCFIFSLLMAGGMKCDTPTGPWPADLAREDSLTDLFIMNLVLTVGSDDALVRAIIEKDAFRGATRRDFEWKYRDDSMSIHIRAVGERRLRVEMSTWGPGSELATPQ